MSDLTITNGLNTFIYRHRVFDQNDILINISVRKFIKLYQVIYKRHRILIKIDAEKSVLCSFIVLNAKFKLSCV